MPPWSPPSESVRVLSTGIATPPATRADQGNGLRHAHAFVMFNRAWKFPLDFYELEVRSGAGREERRAQPEPRGVALG
jgi:hypothetical protein